MPLTLRPANQGDEERLLEWRNDPDTRRWGLVGDEVDPATHHAWFTRKLADDHCVLLVAEESGNPVGQVRLERTATGIAEIHIGLAPADRGLGHGTETLALALAQARQLLPGVTTVEARVQEANERSLRAFARAGFSERSRSDGVVILEASAGGRDQIG